MARLLFRQPFPPNCTLTAFSSRLDWVEVIEPGNRAAVDRLRAELDAGESEAIVLAQQLNASLLLMDERLGRRAAIKLGLDVAVY